MNILETEPGRASRSKRKTRRKIELQIIPLIIIISPFSYFFVLLVFDLSKIVYTIYDQSYFVALLSFPISFHFLRLPQKFDETFHLILILLNHLGDFVKLLWPSKNISQSIFNLIRLDDGMTIWLSPRLMVQWLFG